MAAIADGQWELPTPCTEWEVRALLNHMVYGTLWVPALVEGKKIAWWLLVRQPGGKVARSGR